jgi:hypothetical protein
MVETQKSGSRDDESKATEENYTPADFIEWVRAWLTQANRDRSKFSDIAMVVLTVFIVIAAFWSACIFQGQLNEARLANVNIQRQLEGTDSRCKNTA